MSNIVQLTGGGMDPEGDRVFDDLGALGSTALAAPVFINGEDKALINPPELFSNCPERDLIWSMVQNPSINLSQIQSRQDLISTLSDLNEIQDLISTKNQVYLVQSAVAAIYNPIPTGDSERSPKLPAISQYETNPHAKGSVNSGLRMIQQSAQALESLTEFLRDHINPLLARFSTECEEFATQLKKVDLEYCLSGRSPHPESLSHNVVETVSRFGAFLEVGNLCQSKALGRCEFDEAQQAQYTDGWSPVCPETRTHPNNSPQHAKTTVYAGSNMSGKTESGLKQNFVIQMVAQAFGYSTVTDGNFHIHDSFVYLDRFSTDHGNDLSAYGAEATCYAQILSTVGDRGFVCCIDEGFSTTSPEDQTKMLSAVETYLSERGARTFIATHNEQFIDQAVANPEITVCHFKVAVTDGEPTYLYKLEEGPADSNSIIVAKSLDSDPILVEGAEKYLNGMLVAPEAPRKVNWPSVARRTEDERARLKEKPRYGGGLFSVAGTDDKRVLAFSEDKEVTKSPFPLVGHHGSEFGYQNIAGFSMSGGGSPTLIREMIMDGPTLEPREILERQATFQALMGQDRYEAMVECYREIALAEYVLPRLPDIGGTLLKFNYVLNPFGQRTGLARDEHPLKLAKDYLKLNKKLLGEDFPLEDLLEEIRKLSDLQERIEGYQKGITLERLVERVAARDREEIDPEFDSVITKVLGLKEDTRTPEGKRWIRSELRTFLLEQDGPFGGRYHQHTYDADWEKLRREVYGACAVPTREKLADFKERLAPYVDEDFFQGGITAEKVELVSKMVIRLHGQTGGQADDGLAVLADELRSLGELYRHVGAFEIEDESIAGPLRSLLAAKIHDKERTPSVAGFRERAEAIGRFLEDSRRNHFPPLCCFDYDLGNLKAELTPLVDRIIARESSERWSSGYDYLSDWPEDLILALQLKAQFEGRNTVDDLCEILEGYDSVHTHQMAKSLREALKGAGSVYEEPSDPCLAWGTESEGEALHLWERTEKAITALYGSDRAAQIQQQVEAKDFDELQKLLEPCKIDSLLKPYDNMKTLYKRSFAELHREYQPIQARLQELDHSYASNGWTYELRRMGERVAETTEEIEQDCRTFGFVLEDAPRIDWSQRSERSDAEIRQEYYQNVVQKSELYQQAREYARERAACIDQLKELAEIYDLPVDWKKTSDPEYLFSSALSDSLRSQSYRIVNFKREWGTSYGGPRIATPLAEGAQAACSAALFANYAREAGFCSVDFNEQGVVSIDGLWNMMKPKDKQVALDIRKSPEERLRLINGPNMSGKTWGMKAEIFFAACALGTGWGPATKATYPFIDGIAYFDRMTEKVAADLSSAGGELKRWSTLLPQLRGDRTFLVNIDEAFSTMSPRYQEAFTASVGIDLYAGGHFINLAGHNHRVIDRLDSMLPEASPWYYDYQIQPDGTPQFHRKLLSGHRPSEAIAVARACGIPEEILLTSTL